METLGRNAGADPLTRWPPRADTVVALATGAGTPAALLRTDPGLLTAYLDRLPPALAADAFQWPDTLADLLPDLERAAAGGFADWSGSPAFRFSQTVGRVARRLAELAHLPPDAAEVAGLLSPLGWLRRDACPGARPETEDPARWTRRLARQAPWPRWLGNLLLGLDLPAPLDHPLETDARLLLAVQAAVGLGREQPALDLPVPVGRPPGAALAALGLGDGVRHDLAPLLAPVPAPPPPRLGPLLWQTLHLLHDRRRTETAADTAHLEAEAEQLRHQLARLAVDQEGRLRDQKLAALAEFAAGAGHEINTPLAVVAGQAQHLLRGEENLDRARSLERIIAQTRRIHQLLRDVMLYARPPQPQLRPLNLGKVTERVLADLAPFALERRVTVHPPGPPPRLRLRGDAGLVEVALASLLKNAIEAAPAEGWARLRLEAGPGELAFVVEDNGPGLPASLREHLFDPFYSGRSAGRGAGLGLCKAWRVAQLHGGRLDFHSVPGQPTRFVLALPLAASLPQTAAARKLRKRRRGA